MCVKFVGGGNNGNSEMLRAAGRQVGRKNNHRARLSNQKKLECDCLVKGNTEDYAKLET